MTSPPTDVFQSLPVSRQTLTSLDETVHRAREHAVGQGHEIPEKGSEPPVAEEEDAISTAEDAGLSYIDYGAARLVFALGPDPDTADYVVKLGRYGDAGLSDGLQANYRERRLYEEVGEAFRLLPVLAADHETDYWVVMPNIDPLSDSAELIGHPDLNDLLDELVALAEYIHTPEINPQNVAYYNGELHLFDYGRPPIPLDEPS